MSSRDPKRAELGAIQTVVLIGGGQIFEALLEDDVRHSDCINDVVDPVGAGYVESMARLDGNITGFYGIWGRLEREMG